MSSRSTSVALEQMPLAPIITAFMEQIVPTVTRDSPGSDTITVFRGHEILWCHSSGWANVEQHIPANAESVYRMASITKPVTAAALLCVMDDGRVDLDEPVEHVLPEIRKVPGYADYAPITYRQLASLTQHACR